QGALDRVLYNSMNLGITEEEKEAIRSHPPKAAIVLGYNPRDLSTDGRMGILGHGSGMVEGGLIEMALECGIENLLLDTAATPFDHKAAETLRSIPAMKNRWGYPVGCSIHNTVESWLWLKKRRKENRELYNICDIGSNGLTIVLGADYMVYGPVSNAPFAFPFVGMVDKLVSEGAEEYFGVEPPEIHPRSRME
ncbi:MAG: tetrahydromethanopterin S-methyltransferase subunit H, partial [Thermoplasmata archaeon]|nr:tetrahydromethanopterin S-methyltransferase subunit H [Thermoplasmata archaeon]